MLAEGEVGVGASGQTVLNLVEILPPGTHVFFDNYFASPGLLVALKERGLPAACTIRSNRVEKCPLKSEKELRKTGRGSMDSQVSEDGILLVKWYDNKEVVVGTNHYSVEPTDVVRRWDKTRKQYVNIHIPAVIKAYNRGMGGVDRCDQLLSFYRMKTKAKKWYKRVLYHFMDLALINSFILYRATNEKAPLYEFKLDVAVSLMYGEVFSDPMTIGAVMLRQAASAQFAENGDPVGGEVTDFIRYDGINHMPEVAAKIGRCCKVQGCKKRSSIWCKKCRVYLCLKKEQNCFELWHT
jgi:hypothetical protein